jgi:general secretion pathway protein A
MYTAFYGLREKPFQLSPDPRFLFLAESHREALAHLLFGIEEGEGFIAVTGEVGTGKTTLCRALLKRIGPTAEVAIIFNPQLSAVELLEAIHVELGLPIASRSRRELMEQLNRFLLEKKEHGRRVLLLVDEAQNLGPEALEQIRMLSNLETDTCKLIQIILLGQPEFDALLESPSLRQLRQRISVRWRLGPLTAAETAEYVRYRLRIAAGAPRDLFQESALREIHRRSGGVPRVINLICDRALLAGYAAGATTIDRPLVSKAERELRGGAGGASLRPRSPQRAPWPGLLLGLAVFLGLATLAALGWQQLGASRAPVELAAPERVEPERASVAAPAIAEVASRAAPGVSRPEPPVPAPMVWVDQALRVSDPGSAVATALDVALEAWGVAPAGASALSLGAALAELRARGFIVQPVNRVDVASLAQLNHLAMVSLRAPNAEERSLLLRRVDERRVWVVGLEADGAPLAMTHRDFDARVVGEAWIIWRDFESLPEVLRRGRSGRAVVWLQRSLGSLGYLKRDPTGSFDSSTAAAVRAFQDRRGLRVDGAVGIRTKMALYAALEQYPLPRLASAPGGAQ